jgi:hypothetical protein
MSDVQALVERVREYIESHQRIVDGPNETFTRELAPSARPALAALDSLTAALEDERRWRWENHEAHKYWEARAQKAEAVVEAARALHERVEMDESVGICLSERVESLALGAALTAYDEPPTEQA